MLRARRKEPGVRRTFADYERKLANRSDGVDYFRTARWHFITHVIK
jgi:hypothetical protein